MEFGLQSLKTIRNAVPWLDRDSAPRNASRRFQWIPLWTILPMSCHFQPGAISFSMYESIERLQFLGRESRPNGNED